MVKFIKAAVVVILVLANAAAIIIAATRPSDYLGYRINAGGKPLIGEKLALELPDAQDQQGLKQFAYELYATANRNYKNLESAAYTVNFVNTTLGIPVVGYRHSIKNNDAYLYLEYSFVIDPIQALILGFESKDGTMYAERCYTDSSMDYMYAEKTLEPTHTVEDGEKITYNADWNNLFYAKQKAKPVFFADQEGDYEYTDQIIRPETIQTAAVSYNSEQGYYRLELNLDIDNPLTTSKTLSNLRASSGAADAAYTSMHEIIEIWDNGYFKYFLSEDQWEGNRQKGFSLHLKSDLRYETDFLYDGKSITFSEYQYADELIAMCKNGNMRNI